ncbi:MAG: glycosyltransferase family 39 protein [Planctomycetes bacterium]|nr:glycosyltransferase family 39 protein [Planctomycetota bacterium]
MSGQTRETLAPPAHDASATRTFRRWALVLLGLGVAWRLLRYLLCFPFWGDESYLCVNIIRCDFAALTQPLEYSQVAPLLFLWLQRAAYLLAGGGEYALRAVPLLAGLAALVLFWRLVRTHLTPRAAALAVGIFAASYYLVRHSCEAKPYAVDLFCATLLVWSAAHWLRQPAAIRWPLLTCMLVVPLVWLSYPLVFIAGGISLGLLLPTVRGGRWQGWLWWLAYNAAVCGSFLAFMWLFAEAQTERAAGSWLEDYWRDSFPPAAGVGPVLWWLLQTHTGRMLAYPVGGASFGSVATALLCVLGMIALVRGGRLPLLLVLVAPVVPALLAAVLHRYPYGGSVRVSIHFAPAICTLSGAGLDLLIDQVLPRRVREPVAGGVGLFLIALPLLGGVRDVLHPYKSPEDAVVRRVMADVCRRRIGPDATVAIHNPRAGTHGPPDGPKFDQSLRYYLEYYTGVEPIWRQEAPLPRTVDVILVYRGAEFGPEPARVAEIAHGAGLRIVTKMDHPLSTRWPSALTVYRCAAVQPMATGASASP